VPDGRTEEGYVIASPRTIDRQLLNRTISEIVLCAGREDETRALELLSHIVPEFHGEPDEPDERGVHAMPAMPVRTPSRPNDKGPSATGSG
jgi:O-antigen biosynthesis protein WbqV